MKTTFLCLLVSLSFFLTPLNAQETTSEEYIVEKFDTLWDISNRKLQDAFLWPKLWNVNPHIENPDLIYPGSKILIPSREELMRMPAVPTPPTETKEIPVVRKQEIKKSEPKSVWKYDPIMKKKYIVEKNLFIASGWISDEFPGIGEVTYSPTDQQMVSKNDIVYIKLNDNINEKRFFVIRDIKVVTHPVTGEKIGHQIRIAGILEIIGMEGDMTKARITDSFEDIRMGDGLLPYQEMEPPLIPDTARTPDIQGYIIESHMNAYLVSPGNIIFLDKGKNDGIEVGDVFTVLADHAAESSIGKIQIVSLQPATSGAVLLKSDEEVKIGAKWGPK